MVLIILIPLKNIYLRDLVKRRTRFSQLFVIHLTCIKSNIVLTVSLYNLEDKQKPRTKPSMYPINIHIGEPKCAFIKNLAAYGFLKIGFKVLKQV